MVISIGSDHGGFAYKEAIREHLLSQGHEVIDCGCFGTESVDYPEFGIAAAECVRDGKADRGIVVCTTGIGMDEKTQRFKRIGNGSGHHSALFGYRDHGYVAVDRIRGRQARKKDRNHFRL